MRLFLDSAAITPLSGWVVLAKHPTSESSFVSTAMSSLKFLTAVTAGTVDFQKIEPCQDGHALCEDLNSRSLLFGCLLGLDVVAVGEDAVSIFRRMKCFLDPCGRPAPALLATRSYGRVLSPYLPVFDINQ
ncbi:hypothetical protein HPB52_005094 [Rhipicephalus sanguineus]|uniref:Uncharacterized protein n=1 Tax=Rhipicephalus sanguineus TaxID=34632 RepID=A0A9D4T8R5_RHISA|nr:hypothetical protein HPB52_005094 [Rhipicephalus sanguineus]